MSVYILSGSRTPMGSFMGSLSQTPAPQLGGVAIEGALKNSGLSGEEVNEVFMGNVIQAGVGQAPARQASLSAGLSEAVPCTTVNKVCGSGLQAIIHGFQSITCGDTEVVVAGGMENMSLAPHILHGSRSGFKFGPSKIQDSMAYDGLRDVYTDRPMGNCAEECVEKYNYSREQLDEFAINSFKRAQDASEKGVFKNEISPVTVNQGTKKETVVSEDEGPFKAKFDKIPQLRPAFDKSGKITAANASTINDGAAALVLAGEKHADKAKFKIRGYSSFAHNPTWFTTAPVGAMKACAEKAGLALDEIDLFEVNEAFAVVAMAAIDDLKLDISKVNIFGGAISLGHPLGCSGARIVVTLMNALERENKKLGMASLCIGGGEALALIIERL